MRVKSNWKFGENQVDKTTRLQKFDSTVSPKPQIWSNFDKVEK